VKQTDQLEDDSVTAGERLAKSIDGILTLVNNKVISVRDKEKIPADAKFVIKVVVERTDDIPEGYVVPEGQLPCRIHYESMDPEVTTPRDFSSNMGTMEEGQLAKLLLLGDSENYRAMGSLKNEAFFEARVDNSGEEVTFDLRITTFAGMVAMQAKGFHSIYDYVESMTSSPEKVDPAHKVIDLGKMVSGDEPINLRERTQ
jgi:hypothetical protein